MATAKKYPVVDGDSGYDVEVYGYATTARGACRVARRYFADEVHHAELYGPIHMRDGSKLPLGWVVFTVPCAEAQRDAEKP